MKEGEFVNSDDMLTGKCLKVGTNTEVSGSSVKFGTYGTVDKVIIYKNKENLRTCKVRIRKHKIPEIGDKFSSRPGQKGVCGLLIEEKDMPFSKDGIVPDLIVNPHAIPSRMTVNQLLEMILGKSCSLTGHLGDATPFQNNEVTDYTVLLNKLGYEGQGNEVLYSGITGEQLKTSIFMGPIYYQRIKLMVADKMHSRGTGPLQAIVRQPAAGRANNGGLRIGEMERDGVISHGASAFLKESMMERADKYKIAICNTTGLSAIYNPAKNIFISPMADGPLKFTGSLDGKEQHLEQVSKFGRNFSIVNVPYSFKLLLQELQTMNVQMRLITDDNIEQLESMTYSNNINHLTFNTEFSPQEIVRQIRNNIRNTDVTKRENIMIKTENSANWYYTNRVFVNWWFSAIIGKI